MIGSRQRELLRAIVEEYVKTARPVGSKSLCKKFKCSSATIRNDMATLESKMSELEQIAQQMAAAQYQQQNTGNTAGADTSSNNNNDDFVDADFTEKN